MIRHSKVERVYPLGEYKTLRLTDEVEDIPEDLALNQEFMQKVKYLQFVELETSYRVYGILLAKLHPLSTDDAIKYLDQVKLDTLGEIKSTIEGNK